MLTAFALGFVLCALAIMLGFRLGRAYDNAARSRAISTVKPTAHPAPTIARRAERIASQALKRTETGQVKVISPRKRAQANLMDLEE